MKANKVTIPIKIALKQNKIKKFIFDNPNVFKDKISLLFFNLIKTHIEDKNKINGNMLITMLGIIIGNASVITLLGIGKGAQKLASNQLSNLGANVLFVVPGNNDTRRRGIAFPRNLTLNDALAINEQVPSIKKVAPQISSSEVIQYKSKSFNSNVLGVTKEFLTVRTFDIANGRFISNKDLKSARNIAIIGSEIKNDFWQDFS